MSMTQFLQEMRQRGGAEREIPVFPVRYEVSSLVRLHSV